MEETTFKSKFLTEFKIIYSDFDIDRGSYGTIFKVKERTENDRDGSCTDSQPEEESDYDPDPITLIKVVELKGQSSDPNTCVKSLREVNIPLDLPDHPHIIKIIEHWIEDPPEGFKYPGKPKICHKDEIIRLLFIRMEYGVLKSVKYWVDSPCSNANDAIIILYEIVLALIFLHKNGVIYRDLKPANVVLVSAIHKSYCRAKLVDFGSATNDLDAELTREVGTLGYAPPEMFERDGSYDGKVDIYSFGVLSCELIAKTSGQDNCKEHFSEYFRVTSEGSQLFNPLDFHSKHPTFIARETAEFLATLTDEDPKKRPSAEEVSKFLEKLQPSLLSFTPLPMYDYNPTEWKVVGKKNKFLCPGIVGLPLKMQPLLVTRVTLKYLQFKPTWVFCYTKDFHNLEYLELLIENVETPTFPVFDVDLLQSPYDQEPRCKAMPSLHPFLKTFILHVLNYKDTLENYGFMEAFQLKNFLYFLPGPNLNQIWENKMFLDIHCGSRLGVYIDPAKGYFYINGEATRRLVQVLEHIQFLTVRINNISKNFVNWTQQLVNELNTTHAIRLPDTCRKVRNLQITNTIISGYKEGSIFADFDSLEELSYGGEWYLIEINRIQKFDLGCLPPNLKRLTINDASISLPFFLNKGISLDFLAIQNCRLPVDFFNLYSQIFNIKEFLFIGTENENAPEKKSQPNFELLREIFKTDWKCLRFYLFDWNVAGKNSEVAEFAQGLILGEFTNKKIPKDWAHLKFSRIDGKVEVSLLNKNDLLHVGLKTCHPNKTNVEVVRPNLHNAYAGSSSAVETEHSADIGESSGQAFANFRFEGNTDLDGMHTTLPTILHKDKRIHVEIKNATIEGNISLMLRGCKSLRTLYLENIQWKKSSNLSVDLPKLEKFIFFEDADSGVHLTEDKLLSILFFNRNSYADLWRRGLELLVSLKSDKNLALIPQKGEVTLQRMNFAQTLLAKIGLDEQLKSLVLHKCHVALSELPESLSTIFSTIRSLNVVRVTGIKFADLIAPGKFPHLKNLYYDATVKERPLQEVDLSDIPTNLDSVLIGGMKIKQLGQFSCKNLTILNCILPPNFYLEYPSLLQVEKLLFYGGNMHQPDYREVLSLFTQNDLTWVGFFWFHYKPDDILEYDPSRHQDFRRPPKEMEAKDQTQVKQFLAECGLSDGDLKEKFLLCRNSSEEGWKGHLLSEWDKLENPSFGLRLSTFDVISGRDKITHYGS